VWTLALARPPVNAADLTLARALGDGVAEAEASRACRALVIAGEGRAFCGGIDVKALPGYDAATRADFLRTITRTLAAGAGLALALACDLRVAAAGDYQLGLTEIAAGVPFPAGPLVVARAEPSASLARRLVMTGDVFGPGDATAGEIFDAVVPAAELHG
jgi:enoyl-CoA hydratase/carnithine racemase